MFNYKSLALPELAASIIKKLWLLSLVVPVFASAAGQTRSAPDPAAPNYTDTLRYIRERIDESALPFIPEVGPSAVAVDSTKCRVEFDKDATRIRRFCNLEKKNTSVTAESVLDVNDVSKVNFDNIDGKNVVILHTFRIASNLKLIRCDYIKPGVCDFIRYNLGVPAQDSMSFLVNGDRETATRVAKAFTHVIELMKAERRAVDPSDPFAK